MLQKVFSVTISLTRHMAFFKWTKPW